MRAIVALERIYEIYGYDIAHDDGMRVDNLLGLNYMRIGDIGRAKHLLSNALTKAKIIGHRGYMGAALHNLGCTHLKLKEYEKALGYLKKAYDYCEEGQAVYFENLYYEILCLIATKSSLGKHRLSYARSILGDNEHFKLLFDSLEHLMTLKEDTSTQYIQDTTIAYLIEKCEYSRSIEYCKLLEDFYLKKRNKIKALEIKALTYDIHKRFAEGGKRDDEKNLRTSFGYADDIEL
jgi:tetratricopeptide (TPR) repeat protein